MKTSTLYREAAKLVDAGKARFCCTAIYMVKYKKPMSMEFFDYNIPEAMAMCYLFQNQKYNNTLFRGTFGTPKDSGNQKRRVLALCLMAAIAEADGN